MKDIRKKIELGHIKYVIEVVGRELRFRVLSMDERFLSKEAGKTHKFQARSGFWICSDKGPELMSCGVVYVWGSESRSIASLDFPTKRYLNEFMKRMEVSFLEWDRDWVGWQEGIEEVSVEGISKGEEVSEVSVSKVREVIHRRGKGKRVRGEKVDICKRKGHQWVVRLVKGLGIAFGEKRSCRRCKMGQVRVAGKRRWIEAKKG